jgi:uncharacterized repeat protein (TIGR03806 family)
MPNVVRLASLFLMFELFACGVATPDDPENSEPSIVRATNTTCFQDEGGTAVPALLSETHCFTSLATRAPAAPLIRFEVNAQLWVDGAQKERYFVLPTATSIVGLPDGVASSLATGAWDFPDGTILIKNFLLPFPTLGSSGATMKPVETRFLIKRDAGTWAGYSYKWNADFTDADLLPGSSSETADYDILTDAGTTASHQYYFPSRADCLTCHNSAAGFALGLTTAQLNRSFTYAKGAKNQLAAFAEAGILTGAVDAAALPAMPDPFGTAAVESRARAYLSANCSHCHRPAGGGPFDLRYDTTLAGTTTVCQAVNFTPSGYTSTHRIVPRAHDQSMLWERMSHRGANQMPRLGTLITDPDGMDLIANWIDTMPAQTCP